ncbi:MAG: Lrp/AsnC family transcriptional regulator [Desulfurococcales archaeon]|nr:Lrp/AsnC family transcriptional regulator [Desulfurococcales archaeon]
MVDEVDVKILSELVKNSRTPYRQLAKKLGLGESTVYNRINKLFKSGILKSFTAEIDLRKLGMTSEAIVEIKPYPHYVRKLREALSELTYVTEVLLVSGDYPVMVRVVASSNEELASKIDDIAKIEGIAEFRIRYVFETILSRAGSKVLAKILRSG